MEEIRKRYYTVSRNFRGDPGEDELLNEADALEPSVVPDAYETAGTHEFMFPWRSYPMYLGLPKLRAQPILKVGVKERPIDVYGFRSFFYVSTRVKLLLESIDRDGFEFLECVTINRRGLPYEPYWMMACIRAVMDFDRERSNFVTYQERNPDAPDSGVNKAVVQLNEIYMPQGFNTDFHAFYINNADVHMILDEMLVDSWRQNKFNSWFFTPLQCPSKGEYKDIEYLSFYNYPYWSERLGS
jgi:hypothetical protein